MKKFSEQLHKKSQSVKLKAAERRELRERIVSYMEYHPLPGKPAAATSKKPTPSPYFTEQFVQIPFSKILKGSAVVAALVLVIIPALAERAMPGDGLYAIKVSFNEEVRSTLAFTPYQKIEWETERLNRRIAEARLLASEGRLTDEVEAEVAEAVKQHTENAKREIEVLRGEDEEEATLASIELNTTLEVQAESLDADEAADENAVAATATERPTRLLATVVKEAAAEGAAAAPSIPSYERLSARVEANTTRVQEILTSLDLDTDSADYRDIQRRLEDIDRSVAEAIAKREDSDEAARLLLVDALQRTQRLIVFMTEIKTGEELSLEEIVPVVLTQAEQEAKMNEFKESATSQIAELSSLVASIDDEAVEEKIEFGLVTLRDLEEQLMFETDYISAQSVYEQITDYVADLKKLVDVVPAESIAPNVSTSTATSTENVTTEEAAATTSDQTAVPTEPVSELPPAEVVGTSTPTTSTAS